MTAIEVLLLLVLGVLATAMLCGMLFFEMAIQAQIEADE